MFGEKNSQIKSAERLARTLFLTTLVSFLFFLLLDLWWPGFVSKVFSVHWFLVAAIVSGIWWGNVVKNKK